MTLYYFLIFLYFLFHFLQCILGNTSALALLRILQSEAIFLKDYDILKRELQTLQGHDFTKMLFGPIIGKMPVFIGILKRAACHQHSELL